MKYHERTSLLIKEKSLDIFKEFRYHINDLYLIFYKYYENVNRR